MGDFRARSAYPFSHLRSFEYITATLNELELKQALPMSLCSFRASGRTLPNCREMNLKGLVPAQVLSRPSVNLVIALVAGAVLEMPGLPQTEVERSVVAKAFYTSRTPPSPLMHCCGAIDSVAIQIERQTDVKNPRKYRKRNVYYSLPVQATAHADPSTSLLRAWDPRTTRLRSSPARLRAISTPFYSRPHTTS